MGKDGFRWEVTLLRLISRRSEEVISLMLSCCRFEKQMKEFKAKGYYTMADGTKSNEREITGKKRKSN